jgi:hypothetical protein
MLMEGRDQWRLILNMVMRGYGPITISCERGSEGLGPVADFSANGNEGKGPVAVSSEHGMKVQLP